MLGWGSQLPPSHSAFLISVEGLVPLTGMAGCSVVSSCRITAFLNY